MIGTITPPRAAPSVPKTEVRPGGVVFLFKELRGPAAALISLVPDAVRGMLPRVRQVHPCAGGVRVELHHIGRPGSASAARTLEERLCAMDGVTRAEVNGALRFVYVACDTDVVSMDEVFAILAAFDTPEKAGEEEPPQEDDEEARRHPARHPVRTARHAVEHQARALVELGAGMVGVGVAVVGQVTQVTKAPAALPALLQLMEATPRIRHELEKRIGRPASNVVFASTRFTAQTLALRPFGLFIDSLAALGHVAESQAARHAWHAQEAEFARKKGSYRYIRRHVRRRPMPLPYGPVERYADSISAGALASYGVITALSGPQRALAMLVAGTPKAARLSRDALTSAVGRVAAHRGALILDRESLRLMDRVDTVVFDAEALTMGLWTVHEVLPLVDGRDELHARAYTLLEGGDATTPREQDGWAARPTADVPERAARWRELGVRAVSITHDGEQVALAGMVPELHPYAETLVRAARAACRVVLAGGDPSLLWRLGVEEQRSGDAPAALVRELQAEGHAVAMVARRTGRGLAEADLGIGLFTRAAHPAWDADVLCSTEAAYLLMRSFPLVRSTARRGVRVTAAGAAAGGLLAAMGPQDRSLRRVQLAADCTSLVTLATGVWAGRDLGKLRLPPRDDRTPWHALPVSDVLDRVASSASGLTEAEAAHRRKRPERDEPAKPPSLLRATAEELANPLTPVLGVAAGISAAVGSALDAVLIAGVLSVNGLIGGAQRTGADRALHRLADATAVPVRLRRPDGTSAGVADQLVRGDIIELRSGDAVPADCRVIKARGLEMDESSLTGESQLVAKSAAPSAAISVADRRSMVFAGTTVAAGYGTAVVVATGTATEVGRTADLEARQKPPTGVELRLRALGRQIMPVAIGSGVLLMITNLIRRVPAGVALAPAVSLAVAAVPEGLPFIATLAELAAARRLSTRETLVRNPSTIEALGRVDVLCFDKTGTLTEGHITLGRVSDGRMERSVDELTPEFRRILAAALRAGPRVEGDRPPAHLTDRAVLDGARRAGVRDADGLGTWDRVAELPFEPTRGYHAVLGLVPAGATPFPEEAPELTALRSAGNGRAPRGGATHVLSVKGAPEVVLHRCTTMVHDGQVLPLDPESTGPLVKEMDRLAQQGYRVLAVAERIASDRSDLDESRIEGLCFLGFLGLADPVRPTAAESVRKLRKAGVRVVMITGDHPSTAEAIAAELGAMNGGQIMTGPELDRIDDAELAVALPGVSVFARVTPSHKARIVDGLQRAGRIVAVTGDGANDAPAIKLADVGIALGTRATPAARAAADVVVTDDRIETIVDAIVEGRAMWSSVRDALGILLGGNLGEIAFTVGSNLVAGRNTLNARQLLLVNLLTDMLPALAIAVRPPRATNPEKLLAEGPEASLGTALTRDIYLRAGVTAAAASAAWMMARTTGSEGRADTVGLIGLVSAQLIQTLGLGGLDRTVLAATGASMAALVLAVSIPGVSRLFGCRPVGPVGWTIGITCGVVAGVLSRWVSTLEPNGDSGH
ncbi:cation-translocating P-type ATPase [Sphaerisporangium rubeum]|uniref:Cation-transporting ATPase I n=1 Tax=Sphaerisporangium rubeum TaxID=321317 RepID=A0A7X0MAQ4_9ACTN|nr:cation-translocating P-type ATPase [Sphaerisporangium rubeum]MBB6476329.1 cation-transporting ATPase I [Sphaerisporangium rubeum]